MRSEVGKVTLQEETKDRGKVITERAEEGVGGGGGGRMREE